MVNEEWKYTIQGRSIPFIDNVDALKNKSYEGANIALGGNNFLDKQGIFSPLELKSKYKAIIAVSYKECLDEKCFEIGLPAVTISQNNMENLHEDIIFCHNRILVIDFKTKTLKYGWSSLLRYPPTEVPIKISEENKEKVIRLLSV